MKVVVTDFSWNSLDLEREVLKPVCSNLTLAPSSEEEVLIEVCKDAEALFVEYAGITRRLIAKISRCRIIAVAAVGVDNVDVFAASEAGIWVTNVPDYCTDEVADHAMALLLSCTRQIPSFSDRAKTGKWDAGWLRPVSLNGLTVGIVGFGRIGRAVARRLVPFGCRIVAYDPYVNSEDVPESVVFVDFETLLRESDIITIHVPLCPETANLFSKRAFDLVKKGAYLINTSRGRVVNEDDLYQALVEGRIAGAALDVLQHEPPADSNPLISLPNVLITPHVAYFSERAMREVRIRTAEEIALVLSGRRPRNPVNDPVSGGSLRSLRGW